MVSSPNATHLSPSNIKHVLAICDFIHLYTLGKRSGFIFFYPHLCLINTVHALLFEVNPSPPLWTSTRTHLSAEEINPVRR